MAKLESELREEMQQEQPNLPKVEPTIDGVPMWQAANQERALRERGMTSLITEEGAVDLDANPDLQGKVPYTGPLYDQGGIPGSTRLYQPKKFRTISENYAWNQAQMSAIISGDETGVAQNAEKVSNGGDIENYIVAQLQEKYLTEQLYDYGVLSNIENLPAEERNARILQEAQRFDFAKEPIQNLLAINMLRQGLGELPVRALEGTFDSLSPNQLEGLREQYRQSQLDDLQREIDKFAASQGEGFTTGVALGEMIQQDLLPFYGTITRVVTSGKFAPQDLDISNIRAALPGELRQEIREWFSQATHQERLDYISGIREDFDRLKSGPYAYHFTRYGILENIMGIFTPELLENNVPDDALDRFLGNLDVLVGSVFATGLVIKRGTSVAGLFRGRKGNAARNAAAASGNRVAQDELDSAIATSSNRFGIDTADAAMPELPRPGNLLDDIEVAPDQVKQVVARAEHSRKRVLENSNDITALGLTERHRAEATARVIDDLTKNDTIHANHRMTAIEEFPDNVGARVTVTYGQGPGNGWHDFGDLADELLELDPDLNIFKVVRRGKDGNLEDIGISSLDMLQYHTKGIVPAVLENGLDPYSASTRLFGGRRLSTVSNQELLEVAQDLDPKSTDFANISEVISKRGQGEDVADQLSLLDGDELYIQRSVDHYWQTTDVSDLTDVFRDTKLPSWALPPNYKFTDRFFRDWNRAFLIEEQSRAEFGTILEPFYRSSAKDKEFISKIYEWTEDYAKDMYEATNGLETAHPSWAEIMVRFPDATEGQLGAYASVRAAMDLQHEIFNRRLYRNMVSEQYMTARAVDGSGPNYHGAEIAQADARRGEYFDPYNNKPTQMSKSDIEDLYANGGSLMRLDMEIDGPKGTGMYDTIVVRQGDYKIGELSKSPLNYYAGYTTRFYEDPVYIVKYTRKPRINGEVGDDLAPPHKQAIRTASGSVDAKQWLGRSGRFVEDVHADQWDDVKNPNVYYKIERSNNIDVQEGSLYQKNTLYREGRLFWDKRQHDRLPDTNSNRAKVEDIQQTLEKGVAMAMRQSTQEDLIKKFKNALGAEYGDLLSPKEIASDDLTTVLKKLKRKRQDAINTNARERINDAIKLVKYLQSQLGTDSFLVPALREAGVRAAMWVGDLGDKIPSLAPALARVSGVLEKGASKMDPFRRMRTVAWYTFMVFRPFRQLALQSMQLTYLAGIAPGYIASGRVFNDSLWLWRGMARIRKGGKFNDGWSDAAAAKSMGISKKEYKRLAEEFNRSGLVDTVNVHGFNPRAGATRNAPLGRSTIGRHMYKGRVAGRTMLDVLQKGFDVGEGNNLRFTYMIALRRKLRAENKKILDLTKTDWDDLANDASNLALAMTRPNKFTYQSGAIGTATQFLSFGHKALLGMLAQNPAITKSEAVKIAFAGYLLWGANLLGAEDSAREVLSRLGLHGRADAEILPGVTLSDLLAAGIMESGVNAILKATLDTETELELGVFAPGANVRDVLEKMYETAVDGFGVEAIAGPSGSPIAGFLKGIAFISQNWSNDARSPQEKFLKGSEVLLNEVLPGFSDVNRSWFAYQHGVWLDKDGDSLPLQPTVTAMLARGFLGVRSQEESSLYRLRYLHWQSRENIDNAVKGNQQFLKRLMTSWGGGDYSDEYIYDQVLTLMSFYEDAPEGVRQEIYKRSLVDPTDFEGPSIISMIAELHGRGSNAINDFIPHLQQSADFSAEEKQKLTEVLIEIRDGHKDSDAQYERLLKDNL